MLYQIIKKKMLYRVHHIGRVTSFPKIKDYGNIKDA